VRESATDEGEEPRRHGTATTMEALPLAIRNRSIFFEQRRGWVQRVHDVGMCVVGEKNNLFLAETLSKLRFLVLHSPSTLSTSKNI
jgi:hypothetical protein